MASLTPEDKREEVTAAAFNDGMINGAMTFIPSFAGLWLALKNPTFRKVTNAQSRTAIVIMPPLFIFAVTSEQKLTHRMHEVASENEHNIEVSYNNRFLKCDTYFIFKNDTPTQSIKLFLDDRMG